jgi:O-6-methylguanine DNA methyltransferase
MQTSFIYENKKIGNVEITTESEKVLAIVYTKKKIGKATIKNAFQKKVEKQLEQYFASKSDTFTISVEIWGTPFQMAVWEQIAKIPYGKTKTYSEIAKAIKKPKAVRAVGTACGANPVPLLVPCHRVLPTSGGLGNYAGGKDKKEFLLKLEKAVLCNQKK